MIDIDFSKDYLEDSKQSIFRQNDNTISFQNQKQYHSGLVTLEKGTCSMHPDFQSKLIRIRGRQFHENNVRFWIDEFYIDLDGYPHEDKRSYVLHWNFVPTPLKDTGVILDFPESWKGNQVTKEEIQATIEQQKG